MLRKLNQTGLVYSIGIAINRVVPSGLFRFRIFKVYQIDPETVVPTGNNSAVDVTLAETDADVSAVCALTYFDPSNMDAQLQSAQARINGQLAGAAWVAQRGFDETDLGLRIELAPHQSWLFAALVDQQFRRQGVYSRVLGFMVKHLQKSVDQQFLAINPYNVASVKAHQRYFDSVVGTVITLRVLGMAFCWCGGKRLSRSSWMSTNCKSKPILIQLDATS